MKKFIKSAMLIAMAMVSATMFVSCGDDDDNSSINPPSDPDAGVIKGTYSLYFPIITVIDWPDNASGIDAKYEAYKKKVVDGMKSMDVEEGKSYKYSDMEANKAQAEKMYKTLTSEPFKYSVKLCKSYPIYLSSMHLAVEVLGDSEKNFTIGEQKVECTLDVPSDATCQPFFEFGTTETRYPEAKDYNKEVFDVFKAALKDIFTGEYGATAVGNGTKYNNYANLKGDINAHIAAIKAAMISAKEKCPKAPQSVLSAVPASVKVCQCHVYIYNPKETDAHKLSSTVADYTFEAYGDGTIKLRETIGRNEPVQL